MQKIFLTYEVNNTVLVKKTKNLVCPLLLKTLCAGYYSVAPKDKTDCISVKMHYISVEEIWESVSNLNYWVGFIEVKVKEKLKTSILELKLNVVM